LTSGATRNWSAERWAKSSISFSIQSRLYSGKIGAARGALAWLPTSSSPSRMLGAHAIEHVCEGMRAAQYGRVGPVLAIRFGHRRARSTHTRASCPAIFTQSRDAVGHSQIAHLSSVALIVHPC